MSNSESLVLYTTSELLTATNIVAPSYRQVVGVELGKRVLELPGASSLHLSAEVFTVQTVFAGNITDYFERYYINDPTAYRNCHIGACAMIGCGNLSQFAAYNKAVGIMERGQEVTDLAIGQWGILGEFIDPIILAEEDGDEEYSELFEIGPNPYHSVVGLAPGLAIQTDNERGSLSLIEHAENQARFRFGITSDGVKFYSTD